MNKQHPTTAPAVAATVDPIAFAARLFNLRILAREASTMATTALSEDALQVQGLVAITPHEARQITFLIDEVDARAKEAAAAFDVRAGWATPPTTPASPVSVSTSDRRGLIDFEKAFYDLEELIDVVERRVKTCGFIIDGIDGRSIVQDPHLPFLVSPEERDALHSTARDASSAVDDLSQRFGSVVAQVVAAEHAMREAGETAPVKAEGSSAAADPLLEMIVELRSCRSRDRALRKDDTGLGVRARVLEAEDTLEDSPWNGLAYSAPPALTAAAARAALDEALLDLGMNAGPLAPSLIRSALAYLGSDHVQ